MQPKFQSILLNLFLVWSGAGVLTLAAGHPALPPRYAWADALLVLLAAGNVLFAMARRDGWRDALWSLGIIAAGASIIATIGALTGRPFGAFAYNPPVGPRIGVLPVAVPLAWYTALAAGHYLFSHALPRWSRDLLAVLAAASATGGNWFLEPFATSVKGYWTWNTPPAPAQNYAAVFAVAFLLARFAPWGRTPAGRFDPRPAIVATALLLLVAAGRIRAAL